MASLTQCIELLHQPCDVVVDFPQTLHDCLRFPLTKLTERYLRDDLAVALELACNIDGKTARYSALVTNVPIEQVDREFQRSRRGHNDQRAVLVDNVEIMDDEKERITRHGAVVRLQLLDEVQDFRVTDSLYLSLVFGRPIFLRWPRFKNGKADSLDMLRSVSGFGKQPHDMVEARPQLMDDLSGENTEAKRNDTIPVILDCLRDQLLIVIAQDWVVALLKKPLDLDIEIADVLVGPL